MNSFPPLIMHWWKDISSLEVPSGQFTSICHTPQNTEQLFCSSWPLSLSGTVHLSWTRSKYLTRHYLWYICLSEVAGDVKGQRFLPFTSHPSVSLKLCTFCACVGVWSGQCSRDACHELLCGTVGQTDGFCVQDTLC